MPTTLPPTSPSTSTARSQVSTRTGRTTEPRWCGTAGWWCGSARPTPTACCADGLQVEAGGLVADPLGRDRVDVALAHHHVQLAVDLDLGLVLGVEEDPVADLDGAGLRADRDDLRPAQATRAHGGRGGNDDAAGGAAFAGLPVELDEDPVVEHLDRGLAVQRVVHELS